MAWSAHAWTAPRLALAHAVYAKARKDSAYAPMSTPLGPGNVLLRSFDRQYIGQGTPATIAGQLVLESIKVRDAGLDQNRFSGMLPAAHGRPAVVPRRGGLYCSTDIRAAIAELFHYGQPNLSRHLIGATLMGIGGVMAMGCTVGQGISAISALQIASFVAIAAIVLGAVIALRAQQWWLERQA